MSNTGRDRLAGKQAGRQAGKKPGRQAGSQPARQPGSQPGSQPDWPADVLRSSWKWPFSVSDSCTVSADPAFFVGQSYLAERMVRHQGTVTEIVSYLAERMVLHRASVTDRKSSSKQFSAAPAAPCHFRASDP